MTTIVISQPMFLPWIGLFEQIKQADIFVHYDDVQRPQGRSFTSRVQICTKNGIEWLTAPLDKAGSGRLISETRLQDNSFWVQKHLKTLQHTYYRRENSLALQELAQQIYADVPPLISQFNIRAIEKISASIGLQTKFMKSSEMGIDGRSTKRLVDICKVLGATRYVTGHGARNYMAHEAFEAVGIDVHYMDYQPKPWDQGEAAFTPYVSILDTISSVPVSDVTNHMTSKTVHWRDFISKPDKA